MILPPCRPAPGRVLPAVCLFAMAACSDGGGSQPVSAHPGAREAPVASVEVSPARAVLSIIPSGPPVRLSAVVLDRSRHRLARPVEWASSDPSVVRVDDDGVLTPLRPGGTVEITGTSGGVRGTTAVTVAVYHNDFEDAPEGVVTPAALARAWNAPEWVQGVQDGRVEVVRGRDAYQGGRSLRVAFPRGGVGPAAGGGLWVLRLNRGFPELYASYRFRFGPGFQFVQGGKLPGLAGGAGNTGGARPSGRDGWSSRVMWSRNGRMLQYVYHPDQVGTFGDGWYWSRPVEARQPLLAEPGHWYHVEQRVVMNTPGRRDGQVQVWLDGALVLDRRAVRFRDTDAFGIDAFHVTTFFGGSDPTYAAVRDEVVWFDDFVIGTQRAAPAAAPALPELPPAL